MKNNGREVDSVVEAICQATLKISQVGSLPETLQRIADTARELLNADFAILATFELENLSENFIFSGVDQETADSIAHPPQGIGLLGALSDEQKTIRLSELSRHPQFTGFPVNHPEMRWSQWLVQYSRLLYQLEAVEGSCLWLTKNS